MCGAKACEHALQLFGAKKIGVVPQGKPVIAINTATWWMALRDNGIDEKLYGVGRLFHEN